MSLKILQVSNRVPYPLNEGGTIGIYNYTKGFHEAGCEVTLLALQPSKHQNEQKDAEKVLSKYSRFISYPINTDVKALPAFLNLFTKKSYNVQRFYNKDFDHFLKDHLINNTYDVIQIEGTYPAVYTKTIKENSDALVVLRQHNVEYQIWERLAFNAKNPVKKWYLGLLAKRLKSFEKRHLNIYNAIIPVTEDDGNLFKTLGCTIPIQPSPAGIDMDVWSVSSMAAKPLSLYHIGSLEWMPNREAVDWFLADIWPSLKTEFPTLEFSVAGKRMPDEMLNLNLEGVHLLGEVESAPKFIEDKSICLVPLLSGSGIRLKILEAMSAGKVVISTTIGAQGIKYTIGEDILLADSLDEFSAAIRLLQENPEKAEEIGENARNLIQQHYSNQSVVDQLIAFYQSLIDKKV
jgi:polysaccharide biosynthesis protein PslH